MNVDQLLLMQINLTHVALQIHIKSNNNLDDTMDDFVKLCLECSKLLIVYYDLEAGGSRIVDLPVVVQ